MMPFAKEETTLILFKPDCVRKNLSGTMLKRFLDEGFRIRGMKMIQLDEQILREHYAHIIDLVIDGKPLFPRLLDFMISSPVIALALTGPGVIVRVRELLGPTNSAKAPKGTIRGDFGTDSMLNICHASDSVESANAELARFFKSGELFDYLS
ncbi:MAG: nucleoside-diphosphate kinase [Akkermansia sp.]